MRLVIRNAVALLLLFFCAKVVIEAQPSDGPAVRGSTPKALLLSGLSAADRAQAHH